MWVRGLKQIRLHERGHIHSVASHVGAWIETKQGLKEHPSTQSHPMWVRGLKHRTYRAEQ